MLELILAHPRWKVLRRIKIGICVQVKAGESEISDGGPGRGTAAQGQVEGLQAKWCHF